MTEPDPRDLRVSTSTTVRPVPTRWSDNDMFGHLNNAVYLELFDSVLNAWMQAETGIDEHVAPTLGVVAESTLRYYREVSFPVTVDIGVRVAAARAHERAASSSASSCPEATSRRPRPVGAGLHRPRQPRRPGADPRRCRAHATSSRPAAARPGGRSRERPRRPPRTRSPSCSLRAWRGPREPVDGSWRGWDLARGRPRASWRSPVAPWSPRPTTSPTPSSPRSASTAGATPTTPA